MHVGGWVSVAPREALEAFLSSAEGSRPAPEQIPNAGRCTRIVAARREADGRFHYRLLDVPGWWREEWLAPATLVR